MRFRRTHFALVAISALAASFIPVVQATAEDTDPGPLYLSLYRNDDKLALQYAGRPDGKPMVFRISGQVYAQVPGGGPATGTGLRQGTKLFNLEGYNIRKLVRNKDYIYLVSREILFYTDPNDNRSILKSWKNPNDGKTYPVVPIANDTVNSVYRVKDGVLYGVPALIGTANQLESPVNGTPPTVLGDGTKVFVSDIPLNYALNDDGRYGIADAFGFATGYTSRASDKFTGTTARYTGLEAFDFWISPADQLKALPMETKVVTETKVDAKTKKKVTTSKTVETGNALIPQGPANYLNSWTRISPMPPFTCIGEAATGIHAIYHARAWTLDGFDSVEPWIKEAVLAYDSQYKEPPLTAPVKEGASADRFIPLWQNQTSWSSFFNKELKGKDDTASDKNLTWAKWCSTKAS